MSIIKPREFSRSYLAGTERFRILLNGDTIWKNPINSTGFDWFTSASEIPLTSFTGASGKPWTQVVGQSGQPGGYVSGGVIRPYTVGSPYPIFTRGGVLSSGNQWAQSNVRRGSYTGGHRHASIGVRVSANSGYFARYTNTTGQWELNRWNGSAFTTLQTIEPIAGVMQATGDSALLRLEAQGTTLRLIVNGVVRISLTDTVFPSGGSLGIRMLGASASSGSGTELFDFDGGILI